MPSEAPTIEWPLPRDTISPSALKTFETCAEKFRRQYVKGERDPSSWSSILGNAVHGAQEINLRQKTVTGRDVSKNEIEDFYAEAYRIEVEDSGGISEINWRKGDGSIVLPSKAIDIARPVNLLYHEHVAPTIQPLATEQWITVRVDGVRPRIVGKIDVIVQGAGKIDMKFGGSAVKDPRKDWLLQADIYNLADDTDFSWHSCSWGNSRNGPALNTPANAPGLLIKQNPERRAITEMTVRTMVRAITAYYRMFGPDEAWPGDGKSHTFACGYCPFHPDKGNLGGCPYWLKSAETVTVPVQQVLL